MALRVLAPAKINLYLHVLGRRNDGYHLLDSLVAFADIGDRLAVAPADRLSLSVAGPEAAALAGLGDDNLVLRAARLLAARATLGAALCLEKHLPIASGIGGGSSDAAAALRLLTRLWPCQPSEVAMREIAAQLGADVPACLLARPAWVGGIGEETRPAAGLPRTGIVLANPRQALPTPAVFQARRGAFSVPARLAAMPRDAVAFAAELAVRRNDLTDAALTLVPAIAAVLRRLADLPGALLARMSGSGATCFALFADRATALAAAGALATAEPGWWVAGGALLPDQPAIEEVVSSGLG